MSAQTHSASPPRENRLAHETSPYLLQHKHNPVDWWPWGPDALAEAKRTNRPILLSVGYAACHWCHVMAHESFEDDATARVMNELFVNIKVDREERPDIDHIYMSALHHLGEHGGWPLTMFLTPEGAPVWGGTYFPNTSRYGRPSFVDVLHEVSRIFREEPASVANNRDALLAKLAETARAADKVTIGARELDSAAVAVARVFDQVNGGFRGAPKFPQCSMLEMVWRAGVRRGDNRFNEVIEHTLERMSDGGIYDHLGGGYSRYSVDEKWLVPHFEKMLYDNAQLIELLALAWLRTGKPLFASRARETVAWLEREMVTGEGAFAASLDADSEGEEGKFYVWSLAEMKQALGERDAELFARHYDVTEAGNFEGHNILNRLQREPTDQATEARLAALRDKLLAVRAHRVRPGLDDKVLADWNGLMIAGLVNAGLMLGEPRWLSLARRAFDFIAGAMTRGDRLGHSWRDGKLLFPGLSSDFAAMVRAALALHEATGEGTYLERAVAWQGALDQHYADPAGGYFITADDAEGLVVRPKSTTDDALPNPHGLTAQNLIRLAVYTGDDAWRQKADALFDATLPAAAENLYSHLSLLNALDLRLRAAELVAVGRDVSRYAAAALKLPFIDRIVLRAQQESDLPANHPARAAFATITETAMLVCVGERCSLPLTDPEKVGDAVAQMRG
ncbi:MAG TPA: thioredoxin domain-containing protein [Xanthobacteraceae bacterium]|nr:thioredoxin domain-containing protein [Xanthobacteraceae bacterium]